LPIQPSKSSEDILYLLAINPVDFPLAYPVISHSQQDNNQLQQFLHYHPEQYEIRVLQEHPIAFFYHGKIVATP
jgi:hypothetical protein